MDDARKLKICLISDDFPGRKGCGGVGTYTDVLARGLAALGHRVHVVTRDWGDDPKDDLQGVKVHRVPLREASWRWGPRWVNTRFWETRQVLLWNLGVSRVVRRVSATEGLDLIESPEYRAQGLLISLMQRRLPIVVRLHGGAYYTRVASGLAMGWSRQDVRISEYLERKLVQRARLVVSASPGLAAWLAGQWHLDGREILRIPLPVDDKQFHPDARKGSNPCTLLYVGRISRRKGVDTLIEALPEILRAVPATRVRLVGQEDRGHPAIDHFRRRLREEDVPQGAVEFVGPVRRTALPALYRSAAVCLVPSPGGSSGYTCLEAMASGCAVVAAAVGGGHGVITDREDGLLVTPGSAKALSGAVVKLLSDPALRHRLGRRAIGTVQDRFGRDRVCREIARVYRSLVTATDEA